MTRRVMDGDGVVAKRDRAAVVETIDRRRRLHLDTEKRPVLDGVVVEKQILFVQVNGDVLVALGPRHTGDMIDVRMREQDVREIEALPIHDVEQSIDLVSRIDEHSLARPFAGEHEPVFHEGRHRRLVHQHQGRIAESPFALRHSPVAESTLWLLSVWTI